MTNELTQLTNDELLDEADKARSTLSYYNAAEGEMVGKERDARREAVNHWSAVQDELEARGLKARPGNYLI